ncbi:proteasome subunit alpha type 5 [Dictyostelium discoideum AX4]|uniref:Proteasome subunit alpha type-5 n=1 Tax=Dictyostelium discoideum TaxID=44689 RepID=PSA5_DICDI|nr:proteasome subunit alpha type 5 [Dictyostelium discoideum AX4]Q55G04.1 RecName: Full=Proteasome subunit alpha type-5 [Dictyostelium discoideum]EAL73722.1 proteasome subunit alpha type 5 [Dictyostelium discoideum AX4]|eukprot:XP_647379.1 proteasome subunit alpha type 5 [Dictyostelium discoideum AX4]
MFLTRSEYDRGVNTFSPEGRLFQVEYALEAIKLGIGVQCEEGVVLAVEKRLTSPLLEPSSIQKVVEIDYHLICALSGLVADARTIIDHARIETQNHRFNYNEPMGVESCVQSICDLALRFGENRNSGEERMSRPFGVALLIAGIDEKGPSLYYSDPSGTFTQFHAKAIGAGSEGAQTTLQEKYSKTLTIAECQKLALTTLKQVMEEAITTTNVELAVITKADQKFKIYNKEELATVIQTLE